MRAACSHGKGNSANHSLRLSQHRAEAVRECFRGQSRTHHRVWQGHRQGNGKGFCHCWLFARYVKSAIFVYGLKTNTIKAITARNAKEVAETTAELQEEFPKIKVIGVPADGCKLSDLEMLVKKVNEALGPIDVLLCNAGTNSEIPLSSASQHKIEY